MNRDQDMTMLALEPTHVAKMFAVKLILEVQDDPAAQDRLREMIDLPLETLIQWKAELEQEDPKRYVELLVETNDEMDEMDKLVEPVFSMYRHMRQLKLSNQLLQARLKNLELIFHRIEAVDKQAGLLKRCLNFLQRNPVEVGV